MRKISFILIYVLLVLLLIEVVLRFCYPLPEIKNFNRIDYQVLDVSDKQGAYLRQVDMLWKSFPDTNHAFVHHLNNYGFRDKDWKVEKEKKKRLFVLGDSFTEGMMSDDEHTIAKKISKLAEENGEDLEVFNCGMMGIGLNQYMQFIHDAVPVFKADELILVFYSNDMPFQNQQMSLKQFQPVYYSTWMPRLLVLVEAIRSDKPIPFRFIRKTHPFYKAVPDPRNPWTFKEKELSPHVEKSLAQAMKLGNLNYYRSNWYASEARLLATEIDVSAKLKYIRDFLAEQNCKFSLVYVPSRHQISDYYYQFEKEYCQLVCPDSFSLKTPEYQIHRDILMKNCLQLGIPFQDLSSMVQEQEDMGNHLYWNYDDHMRAKAYDFLGKEIYDFRKQIGQP